MTSRSPVGADPARRSISRGALLLLGVCAVALWLVPPVGVVIATAVGVLLAPWGRRLGERAILSVGVAAALVALVLVVGSALHVVIEPLGWRAVVTGLLVGEAALLWRRRGAPVWPVIRGDDAAGLGVLGVVGVTLYGVYATADIPHSLNGLLQWWARGEPPHDHSSHLPMFLQVMKAQGWDFSSLSPNLLFEVYPMLPVSVWSVGEWTAGVGPATPGLELVRPYVAWTMLTAAVAAAILCWSAGLVARAVMRRSAARAVADTAAWLAAVVTGVWCVLGSLGSMADFAASTYLIGAALTVGTAVVACRSVSAMVRVGWFAVPAVGLVAAYTYPTLAAGLVLPWLAVLVALWIRRRRVVLPFLVLSLVGGIASIGGVRAVTDSPKAGPWGALTGGLPAFEYWPAIALTGIVLIWFVLRWRNVGGLVAVGVVGPLVAGLAVTAWFAIDAVRSGLALGDSYYTNKAVYTLLLASLPITMALCAGWAARRLPAQGAPRRVLAVGLTLVVAVVAVAEVSALTRRPGRGGGVLALPAGIVALQARADAVTREPVVGRVVEAMAREPERPDFVTVSWIPFDRGVIGVRSEYVNLFAGRTGHALSGLDATRAFERYNVTVDTLLRTADPVEGLRVLMRTDPTLALTLVVPDEETAGTLASAVDEFGSERLRIVIAPSS